MIQIMARRSKEKLDLIESSQDVAQRVSILKQDINEIQTQGKIALVSHGLTISFIT
jgi:broad specificity phosphatase PhoE